MKTIVYFSTQFSTVKSGPGRFAEYLRQMDSSEFSLVFVSDDLCEEFQNKKNILKVNRPKLISRFPFYWIYRAWLFSKTFKTWHKKGNHADILMCSSALEAMFLFKYSGKIPIYVMVNDYKYLKAHASFGEMFRSNRITKTISRLIGYHAERYSVKRADLVIANSMYTQEAIKKTYLVPSEKVKVLYKAVDTSSFVFKPKVDLQVKKFLFAKNDWRIGGLDLIIDAFCNLTWQSEIELTVAGVPDHEHECIKKMVKEKGFIGNLILFSLLNRSQLQEQFYKHDVYITMSRQEALGVSLLEAMSSGIPVVAPDEGGIPEVLDYGKAGFLVPKEGKPTLVDVLNRIKESPEIMTEKIEYARIHCRNFSKESMEANLEILFR